MRYQRRTPLLQQVVEAAGVLLAGRGARMLRVLNVRLSRCSVLSQLMRMPMPPLVTPRVLGVDDFSLYGDTYGRSWSMPRPVCPSRSGRDGTPNSSAAGFVSIPASRSSAATVR